MTDYSDYPSEEAQARATRDALADYIQSLPASVYNPDRELWDFRLAQEDAIIDRLIDYRLGWPEQQRICDEMATEVAPMFDILRAAIAGTFIMDAPGFDSAGTGWDFTPTPSDMPIIDMDTIKEIEL